MTPAATPTPEPRPQDSDGGEGNEEPVLYLSFHGGGGKTGYNNLRIYDLDGNWLGLAIDEATIPDWVRLAQLRSFTMGPDGKLYVVNSYRHDSNVVRFERIGEHSWGYDTVFVQGNTPKNPGMFHPYDLAFGPDGDLFVSSQNTDLVQCYAGPESSEAGTARPSRIPGFPPGTFASMRKNAKFATGRFGIRGITFDVAGNLYVAHRDRGVEVFDSDGHHLHLISTWYDIVLDRPIQLRFGTDGVLYIGSAGNNAVIAYTNGALQYAAGPDARGLNRVSAICLDPTGKLYVGSRKGRKVLRYDPFKKKPVTLLKGLEDDPEFLDIM